MKSTIRLAVLTIFLLGSLTGCAQSLAATGRTLEGLGDQFVAVSEQIKKGCDSGVIPQATCVRYANFGVQFKKTYPLTVGLWDAARKASDAKAKGKAEEVARSLAVDLSKLAVEALGAFVPQEQR